MKDTVKNDSPNGWVVQKFGGTSIGKFPDKVRPQPDSLPPEPPTDGR
jgi:hypothetical protein